MAEPGERMSRMETLMEAFSTLPTKVDSIHLLLIQTVARFEQHDRRLDDGDEKFDLLTGALEKLADRVAENEHRLKDLDGGNGWPSFVDLQKRHLRDSTLLWAMGGVWATMTAGVLALGAWLALPFWHTPKP